MLSLGNVITATTAKPVSPGSNHFPSLPAPRTELDWSYVTGSGKLLDCDDVYGSDGAALSCA